MNKNIKPIEWAVLTWSLFLDFVGHTMVIMQQWIGIFFIALCIGTLFASKPSYSFPEAETLKGLWMKKFGDYNLRMAEKTANCMGEILGGSKDTISYDLVPIMCWGDYYEYMKPSIEENPVLGKLMSFTMDYDLEKMKQVLDEIATPNGAADL